MVDLENFAEDIDPREKAQEGREQVSGLVERVESYLFGKYECDECGRSCKASTTYDPVLCEEVRSWHCEACSQHYYRENMHGDGELPQPRQK